MRIAVFGATGRTGMPLVEQALERGHDVSAFVRDAEKLGIDHERLLVVDGDAYTGEGVGAAVDDADAVVSVLGQTSDGPNDLLTVAGRNVLDAMDERNVDRFVTLVGAGVRVENEHVSLIGRVIGWLLRLLNPEVLEDAEDHVEAVRQSDVDWTVIRAPRLSEADARGDYRTGDVAPGREAVARADVADFVLDVLEHDRYVHELPKIAY
jgi:putative NADH-flavin reductase